MTDGRFERPADGEPSQQLVTELKQFLHPQSEVFHHRGTTLAGYSRPVAECGGDWWTARCLPDGKILVLIADVMGHDLGSAIIMSVGKAVCDLACAEADTVRSSELLRIMNNSVFEAGGQGNVTMTCFVSLLDPDTRVMSFASAGHPQPLLVRPGPAGPEGHVLKILGTPLGLEPDATYETDVTELKEGDILFWFTDGVTEARNRHGKRLSDRMLVRVIGASGSASAEELRDRVVAAFDYLHGDDPPSDDVTFVIGRIG